MNPAGLLAHYERIADAPDAISRLRRFILDLAVRGKLVVQDPNDEPASELLRQIALEKARLAKAGEIRKPKAFPAVEFPPFDLPKSWRWTPIREIASDRGQEIPRSSFTYIDVTAIDKAAGVVADANVLEAAEAPTRARKVTRKGDVIYSCVRPYLLNVAVIEEDFDPPPIASTAFAILNGHGLVVPRYIWIVLRAPFMVDCVEQTQRGQAYPAINDADFAALPFPLPPLAEQRRVVAKVDELMTLCNRLEAARAVREAVRDRLALASLARLNTPDPETLQADARFALDALPALTTRSDQIKQLRRTILNLAVRGKLVAQDLSDEPASELLKRIAAEKERLVQAGVLKGERGEKAPYSLQTPFELPPGWTWARLQSLCLTISDGDHQAPPRAATGVPFLVIGDVKTKSINYDAERKVEQGYFDGLDPVRRPRPGDILYTLVGSFGIPAPVLSDEPFCVQRHIGILRPAKDIDQLTLALFLESELAFKQADQAATGIAQKTVSLAGLRSMLLPVPPLPEQRRILVRVEGLMTLCGKLEAAIARADSDRARLLEALLDEALDPTLLSEAA